MDAGSNPSFGYTDSGIRDSDNLTYTDPSAEEMSDSATLSNLASAENDKKIDREVPYRLQNREPVGGVVMSGSEMVFDPIKKYFVRKE
jgi:hypothetical protein